MTIEEKRKEKDHIESGIKLLEGHIRRRDVYENIGERYLSIDVRDHGFMGRVTGPMALAIAAMLGADYRRKAAELAKELGVEI